MLSCLCTLNSLSTNADCKHMAHGPSSSIRSTHLLSLLAAISSVNAGAGCSGPFGDCRASRCCANPDFECYRLQGLYYAQCRPPSDTACGEDQRWACPGWQLCVAANQECTQSRCCVDPDFGCFLNRTEASTAWRAFCEPRGDSTMDQMELHILSDGDELMQNSSDLVTPEYFYVNVISSDAFCEGTPEWRCLSSWQQQATGYLASINSEASRVLDAAGLQPAAVMMITIVSAFLALCAVGCAFVHRRRWRTELGHLEAELSKLRHQTKRSVEDRVPLQSEPAVEDGHA